MIFNANLGRFISIVQVLMLQLVPICMLAQPKSSLGEPFVAIPAPNIDKYTHLAWPKMVKINDSSLIVALCAGELHGPPSSPAVAISTDKGKTFSNMTVLKEFTSSSFYTSCGNVALGKDNEGKASLLAMAYKDDFRNHVYGWKWDGKDWHKSNTANIGNNRTGSVFGYVFPTPLGNGVVGHYRSDSSGTKRGLWIAFEKDGLWGTPHRITDKFLLEPVVIYHEGEYIGLARDGSSTKLYWDLKSRDGVEWVVEPSNIRVEKGALPSPFIVADPNNPNRLLALATTRKKDENKKGGIFLWEKERDESDWKETKCLVEFGLADPENNDFGYPWMVHLNDDHWYMVFYYGRGRGNNSIWALDFKID